MHTVSCDKGTVFHYSADLSGSVVINLPNREELQVPVVDILEFAAEIVRARKIATLEQNGS